MIESETVFTLSSAKVAGQVIAAMKPDMAFDSQRERTDVKVVRGGRKLRVKISSKDIPAFRSAINTYSRLIQLSAELIEDDGEKGRK